MVNMWMVRAGENAFLINDFKDLNIISIGWEIGDLSGRTPEEIKQLMKEEYPKSTNTSLGLNTGQVIRFVCDFKVGDYVISYNPQTRNYLVGIITSDYYVSDKLYVKYDKDEKFYHHFRDVEWIGETKRDDLNEVALKPLRSSMPIFNLNNSAKNDILVKINPDKIEWIEFYMELADKLIEYKDKRKDLIDKINDIFSDLNLELPTLERDDDDNSIIPYDIDPFTIFAIFNKQISVENRINIVNQFKKEFSIQSKAPYSFHGVAVVNNLKSTFYWFNKTRGEHDIDNLWNLFQIALNYSKEKNKEFISIYDKIINQKGIRWNITMALNWIRPFVFINLDSNNRNILSSDEIFSNEFKMEIKSMKTPPHGGKYLEICEYCRNAINSSEKYENFPELSHGAYISKFKNQNDGTDEGIGDENIKTTKYWLISPGSGANLWDEFYDEGIVGIAMEGTGDLREYKNKNEIKLKFQEIFNDKSSHMNDVHGCWQFVHDLQIGDIIFAKKGMGEIIGRGIVESEYEYNTSKSFHNIRKVNWTHKGNWDYVQGNLPMKAITDITNYTEMVNNIKDLFVVDNGIIEEVPEIEYPKYNLKNFLDEVYISEKDYKTMVNLIKNKKNLIIEGAPGVGKTFIAKRLAYSIMGGKNIERVMMVLFHQSYSYEDFVMGYRPFENGFKLREGSFYKFCKKAEEDSDNDYFFIIDEINRGNLSKIFGELFMLIESDKRGEKNKIQLLYSDELFYIPKNVYIMGLMNTADRSIAMIDYALRRRFSFFDLKPGFSSKGFSNYQNELEYDRFDMLIETMKELNQDIMNDESLGEGFKIGHSYLCNFKPDNVEEKLTYVVNYELIPLLKEYWFDEQDKVDYWSNRLKCH